MARIDPDLEAKINAAPEHEQQVVITIAEGAADQATVLTTAGAKEVAPGVFSGLFTSQASRFAPRARRFARLRHRMRGYLGHGPRNHIG